MNALKFKDMVVSRAFCLGTVLGLATVLNAAEPALKVRHLVNEQNIISMTVSENYLLLPVQEDAPESKIAVIINNEQKGAWMNVRLARERVDYYVPFVLSAYNGQQISIDVQGLPESSLCWKELKMSDSFDMTNKEKFRPVYHHSGLSSYTCLRLDERSERNVLQRWRVSPVFPVQSIRFHVGKYALGAFHQYRPDTLEL